MAIDTGSKLARARERYASDPELRKRSRDASAAWRERNREYDRERKRLYNEQNRESRAEYNRRYLQENAQALQVYNRGRYVQNREERLAYRRFRDHGLRPEDWAAIWDAQNGQCYLCGTPLADLGPRNVHVDHDHSHCPPHKSCAVCRRGLACNHCNNAIGHVRDDVERLRRMADALEAAQLAVVQRKMVAPEQLVLELEG